MRGADAQPAAARRASAALLPQASPSAASLLTPWTAPPYPQDFKGTSPRAWLDTGAAAAAASPHHDPLLSAPQPRTFRELYPELARASQLVGYWTGDSSAGPRGSLYRFSLADDCVRVEQLAASK